MFQAECRNCKADPTPVQKEQGSRKTEGIPPWTNTSSCTGKEGGRLQNMSEYIEWPKSGPRAPQGLPSEERNSTGRAGMSPGTRQEKADHLLTDNAASDVACRRPEFGVRDCRKDRNFDEKQAQEDIHCKTCVKQDSTQHERRKRCRQQGRFGLAAKKLRIFPKPLGDDLKPKEAQVSANQYFNQHLDKLFEILVDVRGRNPWNKNNQKAREKKRQ